MHHRVILSPVSEPLLQVFIVGGQIEISFFYFFIKFLQKNKALKLCGMIEFLHETFIEHKKNSGFIIFMLSEVSETFFSG